MEWWRSDQIVRGANRAFDRPWTNRSGSFFLSKKGNRRGKRSRTPGRRFRGDCMVVREERGKRKECPFSYYYVFLFSNSFTHKHTRKYTFVEKTFLLMPPPRAVRWQHQEPDNAFISLSISCLAGAGVEWSGAAVKCCFCDDFVKRG